MPGFDDLQKDPVAALTKGFGWFTTTVGKTAKSVNEGYIQPTAAKVYPPPPFLAHYPNLVEVPQLIDINPDRGNGPSSPSPHHSRERCQRCTDGR